ncbi:hypothetical protein FBUS_04777 [Fasciolopsis buskii]|uniref:SCP domain-containing protein n=1 Tax=Fasciolopsis buskii TaxID=27845 RepID=A0A8E0VMG0_9TREM|nr:hypothetical protein FBUS_04777 [Fasciolopsis buski]
MRSSILWFLCLLSILLKSNAENEVISDELNQLMIGWHNEFRRKLLSCGVPGQPQPKTMPNLTYDPQLAAKAQIWANKCTVGHDAAEERKTGNYLYVGQNFAGSYSFKHGNYIGKHPYEENVPAHCPSTEKSTITTTTTKTPTRTTTTTTTTKTTAPRTTTPTKTETKPPTIQPTRTTETASSIRTRHSRDKLDKLAAPRQLNIF